MNAFDDLPADTSRGQASPSPSLQALNPRPTSIPAAFAPVSVPCARLSVVTEESQDPHDILRVAQLMAAGRLGCPGARCTRLESLRRDHLTLVITGCAADGLARDLAALAATLNPRWRVRRIRAADRGNGWEESARSGAPILAADA